VKRFRGGRVFKADGVVYHSTLGLRVIKKKKKKKSALLFVDTGGHAQTREQAQKRRTRAVRQCVAFTMGARGHLTERYVLHKTASSTKLEDAAQNCTFPGGDATSSWR